MLDQYKRLVQVIDRLRAELSVPDTFGDTSEHLDRLDRIASLLYHSGHFTECRDYNNRILLLLANDPDRELETHATARSCRCLIDSGLTADALDLGKQLLLRASSETDRSEALSIVAAARVKMGQFDVALRQVSLAKRSETAGRPVAWLFLSQGWALSGMGKPHGAIQSFESALSCSLECGWDYGAIRSLLSICAVQKNLGDWNGAARNLHTCIRKLRETCFPHLHAYALLYLSLLNLRLGVPRRALSRINEALRISAILGDRMLLTDILITRARTLRLLGKIDSVSEMIGRAHDIAVAGRFNRSLALIWEESGELAICHNDIEKAERCFIEGMKIAEKIAPEGDIFAEFARRLADIRIEQDRLPEAETQLESALRVARGCRDRREEGTCYRSLGRIALKKEKIHQARDFYGRAVGAFRLISDRIELARTLEERSGVSPTADRDIDEAGRLYARAGMIEDEKRVTHLVVPATPQTHQTDDPFSPIQTGCDSMCQAIEIARRVAPTNVPVLLSGETGTGKELFAHAIHRVRRDGTPFIAVNCSAITESLLESELFGYSAGAFTGALSSRNGILAKAEGGTVFLDEIDKSSHGFQAKLLRFLDSGEVRRIGEATANKISVRVLSATNCTPSVFSEDLAILPELLFRLSGISIPLPPLRERDGDIKFLTHYFLQAQTNGNGKIFLISGDCLRALEQYPWPGNVRELQNEIKRLVLMSRDGSITVDMLTPAIRDYRVKHPTHKEAMAIAEQDSLHSALKRHRGDTAAAADELDISRSALYRKLKQYNIA